MIRPKKVLCESSEETDDPHYADADPSSHFHKPRFLMAVGNVFDLFFLQ